MNPVFINYYIFLKGDRTNVVLFRKGSSDRNILKRLDLDNFPVLNITNYDKEFNQNFSIMLENLHLKDVFTRQYDD